MSTRFFVALSALACFTTGAFAQDASFRPSAEVTLSNDTLQLRYTDSAEALDLKRGRVSGAFFLSEERDIVLSGNWLFPADVDWGRMSVMFGPQAYAALLDDENDDVLAMSIGAEARFVLSRNTGLAIAGHAYYAPDILSFGSADALTDLGARAEIRLAPRLTGFGGMRWFEFDLTEGGGERTLQEEVFVGFGWRF